MSRFRLYFDESGVPGYEKLDTVHHRFLALCGVIFEDEEYRKFQVDWEKMKRDLFHGDPDEPIIIHRKEIMSRSGIFSPLEDEAKRAEFDAAVLDMIRVTPFVGLIVVINKASHSDQYTDPINPYHYCLTAMIQRYCFWLGSRRGDVMGEARGRVEDQQLRAAYESIYTGGDLFHNGDFYQARLTSKEIKLHPKSKNIAGLQLADLLAHPAKQRVLVNQHVEGVSEASFGKQVADAFWLKLRKKFSGETNGYGEVYIG